MTDYHADIRTIVTAMFNGDGAGPLLDTDYKRAFDTLIEDAVRVCNEADAGEQKRFGAQSAILSITFGHPGERLVRPLAMLVSQSLTELHYHAVTARALGARSVTDKWMDKMLSGELVRKEPT